LISLLAEEVVSEGTEKSSDESDCNLKGTEILKLDSETESEFKKNKLGKAF